MYRIKDIPHSVPLFHSVVWEDVVDMVREVVDQKNEQETEYTSNIVDQVIRDEFGEWELHPDIVYSTEGGTVTPDLFELQRRIDTVIGINAAYWRQYIDSLKKATEFNPLWNVDGTETTTHKHGKQKDTLTKGPTKLTDEYGEKQDVANLAKTIRSEKLDDDKVTNYKYATDKTTLEHGDHGIFENVADSQHGVSESGQTVTHTAGQKTVTHRETTMDSTASFKNKWEEETKQTPNTYDSDTYGPKATKETTGNDITTRDEKTDTVTEKPYERKDVFEQTKDAQGNGDVYKTGEHTDTHSTIEAIDTKESDEFTDTISLTRQGNIGITKSTELLEANIEFGKRLRIVPIIANEIAKKLTIAAIWY